MSRLDSTDELEPGLYYRVNRGIQSPSPIPRVGRGTPLGVFPPPINLYIRHHLCSIAGTDPVRSQINYYFDRGLRGDPEHSGHVVCYPTLTSICV